MGKQRCRRRRRRRRYHIIRAAAAGAAATAWPLASPAATDSYNFTTGGGNWSTAANWSLGHQPGDLDDAVISTSSFLGLNVTYDALATATNLASLTIDSPNHHSASLTQALNNFSTVTEYVGVIGSGSLSISGGTHIVSGFSGGLYFGSNAGSVGNGSLSGSGVLAVMGQNFLGEVIGDSGSGTFNQSGGSNTSRFLALGNQAGGSGTYTLTGGTLNISGQEYVGALGTGIFNQSGGTSQVTQLFVGNGAYNQSGGSNYANLLYIGSNTNSTAAYNLSNSGNLTVGVETFNGPFTFNQTGGTHVAGGVALSTGTMNVSGGVLSIGAISNFAGATLNVTGGSVTVQIGKLSTFFGRISLAGGSIDSSQFDIPSWSQLQFINGTLNLSGSATNAGNLAIASNGGSAVLNQNGGSSLVTVGGDLLLAAGGSSSAAATYNLSGGGLLWTHGNEYVGYSGAGIFNQTGGTHVISGSLYVNGISPGSSGTYNLMGGSLAAGSIVVNPGGRFNSLGAPLTLQSLTVAAGGTFAASCAVPVTQPLLVNAGTLIAQGGNLVLNPPNFSNSGVLANSAGTSVFVNSTAVTNTGSITINAQGVVAFAAPLSSTAGQGITLVGGALVAPRIVNNGTVSGSGQILGDLANNAMASFNGPTQIYGNLTNAAGANVTVRNSQLLITGQTINNGTIRATSGGSIAFDGGLSGNAVLSAGGAAAAAAAYSGAVTLEPNSSLVSPFLQQDSLTLRGISGVPSSYSSALIRSREFGGSDSTLHVLSIQTDGAGQPLGRLDLADTRLTVDEAATPAATIKRYLTAAYTANEDWSGPVGITSNLAAENPVKYSLAYASGSDQSAQDAGVPVAPGHTLVHAVLTGDANLDGAVNFFDITQLLGYKYNTGQPASYTDGDLNYDGVVDFFDIATLLSANYNTGETYLGAAAAAASSGLWGGVSSAPEPIAPSVIGLALAALLRRRRRRALCPHHSGLPRELAVKMGPPG
jgi:hypothetical protein